MYALEIGGTAHLAQVSTVERGVLHLCALTPLQIRRILVLELRHGP
jgi:hypothetical protein